MLMKTTKSPLTFLRMLFSLPEDQEKETRRQDSLSHDHQYECCVCHGGFVTGGGAVIADELFCTPCLKQYNHYARFLDLGLTGGFIHYLTEYRMRYL